MIGNNVFLSIIILLLILACASPTEPTRILEPTNTPGVTKEYIDLGDGDILVGDAWMYYDRGKQEADSGNYRAALQEYMKARDSHLGQSAALESLIASTYDLMGNPQKAIEHYLLAIEIRPTSSAHASIGQVYIDLEQYDLAADNAKKSLSHEPQVVSGYDTRAEANYVLMNWHFYEGRFELALEHAETVLRIQHEAGYPSQYISDMESIIERIRDEIH